MDTNSDFYKLIFLIVGNLSKWIYFGGRRSIDEISKEDNFTLGLIVSIVLAILSLFTYNQLLIDRFE